MSEEKKEEETSKVDQPSNDKAEVLLVHNKQKKKVMAVKGIDKTGQLETAEPNEKNQEGFLRVDKHGNPISNLAANYWKQLKNPTNFQFFKVRADSSLEKIAAKIQKHIDGYQVEGEKFMKERELKLKGLHEQKEKKNDTKKDNYMEKTTNASSEMKDNHFSVDQIDWKSLHHLGWTREQLEKTNLLGSLLKGYKTNDLLTVSLKVGNEEIETKAKLWLEHGKDGTAIFKMLPIKHTVEFDKKFHGYEFTEEDRSNLLEKGNMGKVVELMVDKKKIPHVITLDKDTKQIVSFPASKIHIDDEIKGVKLTAEQKQVLLDGKPLYLEGMVSRSDTLFNAEIQFNAFKGHIEFIFDNTKSNKRSQQQAESQLTGIPEVFRRKKFSAEELNKISKGETVYITDFENASGKEYPGYVWLNKDTGKLDFDFKNPNALKDKTRAALKSEGESNEATKKIKEPLKSGQTVPDNKNQKEKQEEIQESDAPARRRGRKM